LSPEVRAARRTVEPGDARPCNAGPPGPNNGVTPGPTKETGRHVGRGVVRYGDGETTSMLGASDDKSSGADEPPAGEQAASAAASARINTSRLVAEVTSFVDRRRP
jgi:hypothetical protein